MITVADIIRAEKTNVCTGEWKSGKIPSSAFPLTKGTRAIPVGPSWEWRLCKFDALGFHCRVLIRLNVEKCNYYATLGFEADGKFRVICHHEFHMSHRGWHCHFTPGSILDVFPGVLRDSDRMRPIEAALGLAVSTKFDVTRSNGLTLAAMRYRFQAPGGFL